MSSLRTGSEEVLGHNRVIAIWKERQLDRG
jgi:hypothetical protein